MNLNYMKEFGNVYSRKVFGFDSMIKLDPLEPNILNGLHATQIKTLSHKDIYAVYCGEGTINAAHTMDGYVYLTTENNLESGFSKAFEKGPTIPFQVLQISIRCNDAIFLSYDE